MSNGNFLNCPSQLYKNPKNWRHRSVPRTQVVIEPIYRIGAVDTTVVPRALNFARTAVYRGYVGIGTSTSPPSSTSALSASSMPSDVPAVMNTRSAVTGNPFAVYSAATASRAAGMPADGP